MADGRMLAKKISLNEAVASLENDMHRLLFTWGLSHLDIEGRISGSPKVFRAMVVPLLDHITPEKVSKFFKDAVEKGLIFRYQVGRDWFIQYPKFKDNQRLRPDREAPSKLPAYTGELPEDSGTTPGVIQEDSGLKLREDKLREDNKPPLPPKRGCNGFDAFWLAYPKKIGKGAALKKWEGLKRTGRLPPMPDLIAAVERQKGWDQWQKDEGQYIPNPATWLNQARWDDQPPEGGKPEWMRNLSES